MCTCCTSKAVGGLGAAIAAIQPERPLHSCIKGPEQCNRGATFASIMSSQTADSIDGAAAAFSSFGRISQSGDTSDGATDARSSMKLGSSDSSAHVGALLGRCMSHGLQLGDGLKEGGPGVRVGFDKYGRGLFTDKRIEPDKRLLYVPEETSRYERARLRGGGLS